MAGKTIRNAAFSGTKLYQLGNWMAGKTIRNQAIGDELLYQLGNWMAGKTAGAHGFGLAPIVPTGELDGRQD